MEDDKKVELAKEMLRQRNEAKKIGRLVRTIISDMCRARQVNYNIASDELMAHALSMSRIFTRNSHNAIVEELGIEEVSDFSDVFSRVSISQFLDAGERIADDDSSGIPSVFDILKGDKLNNMNLAKCLFFKKGISIESQSDTGFLAGREGIYFKIEVSVRENGIVLFTYFDEEYGDINNATMDCARYNSQTRLSKAHLYDIDKFQIHFSYIYPHSGIVNVTDVLELIFEFVDEYMSESKKISWGDEGEDE